MTRPHPAAARGTYTGLLRAAPQGTIWRPQATFRIGSRLDRPRSHHERLTADGDRIRLSPRQEA